jgi:uncharacterized protein (TIGR02452 family)
MDYFANNIQVFEDTRHLSQNMFIEFTEHSKMNTNVIADASKDIDIHKHTDQSIVFVPCGTIQAAIDNHSKTNKIAVLNFADALMPGGLVKTGADTQEECICRCSNLYECLIQDVCDKEYYKFNDDLDDVKYSNRLIYSEDVLIFKDEAYSLLASPFTVDVISCPAPICCEDASIWEDRIKCILSGASKHNCDTIILGAWGCGAFGNNTEIVATAFKTVLNKYKLFNKVIFAIRPADILDKADNYDIFRWTFKE